MRCHSETEMKKGAVYMKGIMRPMMAIIISLVMCLSVTYPTSAPVKVDAATIKLSATTLKIPANKSKVLKMKNTSKKVTWSIVSGKNLITLKNKKKTQVTIKAKKKGTAKVKGVITISSKKKITKTCTVKVTSSQWECPGCMKLNTGNFCSNCGHSRPTPSPTPWLVWPTPTVSGSPLPSSSVSPSPTPVSPEAMTDTKIVMTINQKFYFSLQLYANAAAQAFYRNVVSRGPITYDMGPDGENERFGYLEIPIATCLSNSSAVSTGEVFLYGTDIVKLSLKDHQTGALPTRIGKVIPDHLDMIKEATDQKVDGKTIVEFRQYI